MRTIRWAIGVVIGVMLLQGGSLAWASPVSVPLSQTSFGDLVVDNTNDHVFISSPADNSIAVYDFSGNLVSTITGVPAADGMVIHGSTLYVAEHESTGAIEQIDLSTLADDGPLVTGLNSPSRIAYAGAQLWVAVADPTDGDPYDELESVSLAGATSVFRPDSTPWYYGLDFATSPGTPNILYAVEDGLSPGSIYKLDVSSGTPVVVSSNTFTDQENIGDTAISPDGTRVIPAGGAPYEFEELSASTLSADGVVYPGQPYPDAVAVSAGDGGRLATGMSGYSDPDIAVYSLGAIAPIFTAFTAPPPQYSQNTPVSHGLALNGDGSRLFAVTAAAGYELWIFGIDPKADGTAVSADPNPAVTGQPATLTATVAPTDDGGTVAFENDGAPIAGCSAQTVTGSPNGTATCTTESLPVGEDTITASYSGDSAHSSSSGTATVSVELPAGSSYTWTGGDSASAEWSQGSNWSAGAGPYGTVGTLTFPNLGSSACPSGCVAYNDVNGLDVVGLVVDSDPTYRIGGDSISLGSGGLTVESPDGNGTAPTIAPALSLTAAQTWNIDEGPTVLGGLVDGDQPVTVNFDKGSIEPQGSIATGDIAATGNGGFYLAGGMSLDANSSDATTVSGGAGIEADQSYNNVGTTTVGSDGWLSVGGVDDGGGELSVDGDLAFEAGSELDLAVDAPGTTAGLDYSQVDSTGNVDLSGAQLEVVQGPDLSGQCDDLGTDEVLTLISTDGTLSGTFSNYADGASVDISNGCDSAPNDATGTIRYSTHAVTLTITAAGDATDYDKAPVELTAPSLPANTQVGQPLEVDPGSWQYATSFQYSWWACGTTTCDQIPGASSESYTPTASEVGDQIGAIVTAVGPGGSSYDYTNLTGAVIPQAVPIRLTAPSISGTPTVPGVLNAVPGSWTNSPSSFGYQWERCSSSATDCALIPAATASSYTLARADLDSTIEVQVIARNAGGTSSPALSAPTDVVTAAKIASGSATSSAAVIAALDGVPKPAGQSAALSAVLSHHGYALTFHAPGAGRLSVTWTAVVKHRTVTVAKGSATASSAQSVKIEVRLTPAGLKDLRRYSPLKIKSMISFTATGQPQVVKSMTFILAGSTSPRVRPRAGAVERRTQPPSGSLPLRLLNTLFGSGDRAINRGRTQLPRSSFSRAG